MYTKDRKKLHTEQFYAAYNNKQSLNIKRNENIYM